MLRHGEGTRKRSGTATSRKCPDMVNGRDIGRLHRALTRAESALCNGMQRHDAACVLRSASRVHPRPAPARMHSMPSRAKSVPQESPVRIVKPFTLWVIAPLALL